MRRDLLQMVVGAEAAGSRDDLKWESHTGGGGDGGRREMEKDSLPDHLPLECSYEFSEGGSWLPSSNTLSETLSSF